LSSMLHFTKEYTDCGRMLCLIAQLTSLLQLA
jgi:hypothetical protein